MKTVSPRLCRLRLRSFVVIGPAALLASTLLCAGQSANTAAKPKTPTSTNPNGTLQTPSITKQKEANGAAAYSPALVEQGKALFQQNCAFCHGRDAGGGETGPDLTRSDLVSSDVAGDKIGAVVTNGRPDAGMPAFHLAAPQIASLVAFIHTQQMKAKFTPGGRRGVDVADLQTGNAEAGKQYFNGAGGCSSCHSPTGDLAGIASRLKGLKLEMQMLYPRKVKSKVTVTPAGGEPITGELAYLDEFTVALTDSSGRYRSWPVSKVTYKVDAPVEAHADLLSKYTDADIHNLMAYLQTLR